MYVPYQPISQSGDSTAYVPQSLAIAQQQGIALLDKERVKNWDQWITKELGFKKKEDLFKCFSAEQIDSIGLTITNFERGNGFIVADETGVGKGRILSGICRWAIKHGKKVIFFTEKESLFSDFWRDLNDTQTIDLLKDPTLFHSAATIYDQITGEAILKGRPALVKKIESEEKFSPSANLIMTNYSQISGKTQADKKLKPLLSISKNSVIILDESHNGSGNSNTKKVLMELLKTSKTIVFSSATYIKDESQLDLYKQVMDFDNQTIHILKKTLEGDGTNNLLRSVFTYELTKKLQFWRREHEPAEGDWKVILCNDKSTQELYLNKYSYIINSLFGILMELMKNPEIQEDLEIMNVWFSLGSTINRLSKNLLLLLKIDDLSEAIVDTVLNKKEKAVIVIDSTFLSIISKVIDFQINMSNNLINSDINTDSDMNSSESTNSTTDEEEDNKFNLTEDIISNGAYELNFKQVLLYIMHKAAGEVILKNKNIVGQSIIDQYETLKKESDFFESLAISPIDKIIDTLAEKSIVATEVSGRNYKVVNGRVQKYKKIHKTHIVSQFNSGGNDVIILTRAGASGLSLHASRTFADQRTRNLFELEINTRSTFRLQFIGRVNRKNQSTKPNFYTVVTSLPFEQRILNIEQRKLQKLQSHISGDSQKLSQTTVLNLFTDYCNNAAKQFLINNKDMAYQMGISLRRDDESLYYVDSLLKRCIILKYETQDFIYNYLQYAAECELLFNEQTQTDFVANFDRLKTFWFESSGDDTTTITHLHQENPTALINNFNYTWVGVMKSINTYKTYSNSIMQLESELKLNQYKQEAVKDYLMKTLQDFYSQKDIKYSHVKEVIEPILCNITIGKQVYFSTDFGEIYGYISDIQFPNIKDNHKYSNLCILNIITINPQINKNCFYSGQNYRISIHDIINANPTFSTKPIDFNKYSRTSSQYQRTSYSLIGNPVYIEFLKQCYDIGTLRYIPINGDDKLCLFLPPKMLSDDIFKLKKPLFNLFKLKQYLISGKITEIATTWKDPSIEIPVFKITRLKLKDTYPPKSTFLLHVPHNVNRDFNIITYPIRAYLNKRVSSDSTYAIFELNADRMVKFLFMLDHLGYVWFGDFINKYKSTSNYYLK